MGNVPLLGRNSRLRAAGKTPKVDKPGRRRSDIVSPNEPSLPSNLRVASAAGTLVKRSGLMLRDLGWKPVGDSALRRSRHFSVGHSAIGSCASGLSFP